MYMYIFYTNMSYIVVCRKFQTVFEESNSLWIFVWNIFLQSLAQVTLLVVPCDVDYLQQYLHTKHRC